jgi:hypothetical protein
METGLFEIQAEQLKEFKRAGQALPASQQVVHALFGRAHSVSYGRDPASDGVTNATTLPGSGSKSVEPALDPTVELARCFFRLANLPNFALDRLSHYEATLWRQAGRMHTWPRRNENDPKKRYPRRLCTHYRQPQNANE